MFGKLPKATTIKNLGAAFADPRQTNAGGMYELNINKVQMKAHEYFADLFSFDKI